MCLVCVTIVVVSDLILCLGVDNRFLYDFTTWGKWFLVILYQDISATTMELCWVSMKLSPRLSICMYQETCQHLWSIYMYSAYICTRVFEWWQKESWSLMILLTYDLSLMTMIGWCSHLWLVQVIKASTILEIHKMITMHSLVSIALGVSNIS